MAQDPKDIAQDMGKMIISYFRTTPVWVLPVHMLYIVVICICLTGSYIAAFHFGQLLDVYKEAHNIAQFSDNLKTNLVNQSRINDQLTRILEDTGAMRAYDYRYHNGLAAVSGVPFFFQSNMHEVIAPGASRILQFEQRIPITINVGMAAQFAQDKCVIISSAESDANSVNHYYWQSRGAKSMVRCPITMSNNDLFGYVGLDFSTNRSGDELKQIASRLKGVAASLGALYSSNK